MNQSIIFYPYVDNSSENSQYFSKYKITITKTQGVFQTNTDEKTSTKTRDIPRKKKCQRNVKKKNDTDLFVPSPADREGKRTDKKKEKKTEEIVTKKWTKK